MDGGIQKYLIILISILSKYYINCQYVWSPLYAQAARNFYFPRFYNAEPIHDNPADSFRWHPGWEYLTEPYCGIVMEENDEIIQNRIIGGGNVSLGLFPWIARLGYVDKEDPFEEISFRCGGALITPWIVLTAAHCVTEDDLTLALVRLGEHDERTLKDCEEGRCAPMTQDFRPAVLSHHSGYEDKDIINDIALIKLNREAVINNYVSTICLPHIEIEDIVGQDVAVAGWGYYNQDISETSVVLRAVNLPVVAIKDCQKIFGHSMTVDNRQLCVGGIDGLDSCNGDSGGPIMIIGPGATPRWYILGMVSYGATKCGEKGVPALYTNVSKFLKWILDNVYYNRPPEKTLPRYYKSGYY